MVSNGVRKKLGTTPVEACLNRATAYDVSVRKDGYATWNSQLVFGKRGSLTVSANLQSKTPAPTARTS